MGCVSSWIVLCILRHCSIFCQPGVHTKIIKLVSIVFNNGRTEKYTYCLRTSILKSPYATRKTQIR